MKNKNQPHKTTLRQRIAKRNHALIYRWDNPHPMTLRQARTAAKQLRSPHRTAKAVRFDRKNKV